MINRKDKRFLCCIFIFAIVSFIYYFEGRMNVQNTTAYLFSYKYGFIPRGLVGTVINGFFDLVGVQLTYNMMLGISLLATVLLFICIFALYIAVLKRTERKSYAYYALTFLSVICFPMFLTWNNFGRLDEYLIIATVLSVILLITEKAEWLVILLCLASCFIHVGFVFTNAGVILAILLYKVIDNSKKRAKYLALLLIVFLECAVSFVITELVTSPVSQEAFDIIVDKAQVIADQGGNMAHFQDAYSLLNSELLKESVYSDENVWRIKNYVEAPIFIIFFLPYIIIGLQIFVSVIRKQDKNIDKLKYLSLLLGILTIVPELILKVDYGRWMFNILLYYSLVLVYLLSRNDISFTEVLEKKLKKTVELIKFPQAFVIYPIFFMPFRDVYISDLTTKVMNVVGRLFRIW